MSLYVRAVIRRRRWGGGETALARRARRLFGAQRSVGSLYSRGLAVEPVREPGVKGEWITPPDAKRGAVFYIHGGGYVACSPSTHRPITATLAKLCRRRVFAADYRLAPEHRYPAALDDCAAAYGWLLESGLDAGSITLVGDSAGGGLVLGVLLRARDAGLAMPACAVCISPWTDLAGTGASLEGNDGRCAMFRPENITDFAAAYLGGQPATDPYASPVFADLAGLPPMLVQVGSTELLLDDARRVHEKVVAAGGESRLEIFDDVAHCWHMMAGVIPEATAALRQAADFVERYAG